MINDISGVRFGNLLVSSYVSHSMWLCKCDCGNETKVRRSNLTTGNTKSCGCKQREVAVVTMRKHGCRYVAGYGSWQSMKDRCFDKNHVAYKHYGERGVTICERWMSAENFFADMGERPEGKMLDRINVNGNYEPVIVAGRHQ